MKKKRKKSSLDFFRIRNDSFLRFPDSLNSFFFWEEIFGLHHQNLERCLQFKQKRNDQKDEKNQQEYPRLVFPNLISSTILVIVVVVVFDQESTSIHLCICRFMFFGFFFNSNEQDLIYVLWKRTRMEDEYNPFSILPCWRWWWWSWWSWYWLNEICMLNKQKKNITTFFSPHFIWQRIYKNNLSKILSLNPK